METKIQSVDVVVDYKTTNGIKTKEPHSAKYKIGDWVYFIYEDNIKYGQIDGVCSQVTTNANDEIVVTFFYNILGAYVDNTYENEIFASKEDLMKHLLKNIENVTETAKVVE